MKAHKNILNNVLMVLFTFAFLFLTSSIFAQIKENEASTPTVADTVTDDTEDLLDSNANYKQDYDNLTGSGDWIQVTKGAITSEMMDQTEDDIAYSEDPLDSTDAAQIVYVWRPYVAGPYYDWDPYCNGRWEFTYAGWIWISDYEWGWAPYHYGRWWYSGYYGWLWFPGRMWGANWCSWREHNGYYGWHPRSPHIWWRNRHGITRNNHIHFSNPERWKFVDKNNITKNISKTNVLNGKKNIDLIKNSTNISKNVNKYENGKKFVYNGPNVNSISGVNGEKIVPKEIVTSNSKKKSEVTGNVVSVYKNNESKNVNKKSDNGAITSNTNGSKSNASLQTSARTNKKLIAQNNNNTPNNENKKVVLHTNNEFYKVQAKTNNNKVTNNANKVGNNNTNQNNTNKSGNNNQRVKTNPNNTNKSGNNNQRVKTNPNNTNKSGNNNNTKQAPPTNNTNKNTTRQKEAKVHSSNQNTTKTNNTGTVSKGNTNKGSNNSGTVNRSGNNGSRNNGNYGSRNSGNNGNRQSSPPRTSTNNGSKTGRSGRK